MSHLEHPEHPGPASPPASPLPAQLTIRSSAVELRRATTGDIKAIVGLLADDPLGSAREVGGPGEGLTPYQRAFEAIDADPGQLLVVATEDGDVVATMQLTFIPGLSRRGALRMLIEAVRVAAPYRSRGLGAAMMLWAIEHARSRGCAMAQLTSDKSRADAHRFYQRLGFVASHEGYKLPL